MAELVSKEADADRSKGLEKKPKSERKASTEKRCLDVLSLFKTSKKDEAGSSKAARSSAPEMDQHEASPSRKHASDIHDVDRTVDKGCDKSSSAIPRRKDKRDQVQLLINFFFHCRGGQIEWLSLASLFSVV